MWIVAAVFSAIFAALTAILAKLGIKNVDSDVVTAIRTVVVLAFSWLMVGIVGSFDTIAQIEPKALLFLILSGIATGASWLCYFKALAIGDINKVVPIDKSSSILTILLAILLFGETNHLLIKLSATVFFGLGVYLMIEKKRNTVQVKNNSYLIYAVGSAVFAALTSILAKIGIDHVESNLATAIRTIVVLLMAILIVIVKGKTKEIKKLTSKDLWFIILSGIATGASWLCYYYAIQNGIVSVVGPIDKMSLLPTVIFSYFVFKEKLSKKALLGLTLMLVSTLVMVIFA